MQALVGKKAKSFYFHTQGFDAQLIVDDGRQQSSS